MIEKVYFTSGWNMFCYIALLLIFGILSSRYYIVYCFPTRLCFMCRWLNTIWTVNLIEVSVITRSSTSNDTNLSGLFLKVILWLLLLLLLLLLPNTGLQQTEDYVRCCTWQLKKVKTIYMFYKLVFDRGRMFQPILSKLWAVGAGSCHISYEGKTILDIFFSREYCGA